MKAVVAAFNQEKALVGAFSVITNLRMELLEALEDTLQELDEARLAAEESLERMEIDSRDVDKILALLVQLKYGPGARGEQLLNTRLRDKLLVQDAAAEAEQASNRMDIHDFVTR